MPGKCTYQQLLPSWENENLMYPSSLHWTLIRQNKRKVIMRCISSRASSTMSTSRVLSAHRTPSVCSHRSCSTSGRPMQAIAQRCKSIPSVSSRACVRVLASASPQQGSGLAPDLKASIDQLVAENTILVFMKGNRQVSWDVDVKVAHQQSLNVTAHFSPETFVQGYMPCPCVTGSPNSAASFCKLCSVRRSTWTAFSTAAVHNTLCTFSQNSLDHLADDQPSAPTTWTIMHVIIWTLSTWQRHP